MLYNLPSECDNYDIDELLSVALNHVNNILAICSNDKLHKERNKTNSNDNKEPDENKKESKQKSTKTNQPKQLSHPAPPDTDLFYTRSSQNIDVWAFIKTNEERQFRIQEDMVKGTYSPTKYMEEVKLGYCIWHNTRSHDHTNCDHINELFSKYPNQYPNQNQATSNNAPTAKHTTTLPQFYNPSSNLFWQYYDYTFSVHRYKIW